MEIIFVMQPRRNRWRLHLGHWFSRFLVLGVVALTVSAFLLGVKLASNPHDPAPDLYAAAWQAEVLEQRREVGVAVETAQLNVDALATKLAELQARMVRLDALGGRLVELADLDTQEFDFGANPAVGGVPAHEDSSFAVPDFVGELRDLSARLTDRAPKLEAVESAMMSARLLDQIHPQGRPVLKGWLSSRFGWRADPITGRKNFHEGIDFAGRKNSSVVAVAAGVVRWSGRRSGYGKVVELSHGNGYVTRYAHNSKNLVKIGNKVAKGETIALMGATGYATGVHVHFEVLKNGRPVNPLNFVKAKKK